MQVDELNKAGYNIRLTDPEQAYQYGEKALELATKINYIRGQAEAYRVIGIGYYYLRKNEKSLASYLTSLSYFKRLKDFRGQAKVYNNIGNLYRDVDYDKGLYYFQKSLDLAKKFNIADLTAGCYLNIGTIYYRKKKYNIALNYFNTSDSLFNIINNPIGITQCLQDQGVIYFNLDQIDRAEELLLEANKKAKENELNNSVASIDLTLTSVYIVKNEFEKAEVIRNEGLAYAKLVKDNKIEQDFSYISYQLESKRKNYKQALYYLQQVYKQDSASNINNESVRIGLLQEQFKQREKERQNELIIERQKTDRLFFIATAIVAILLLALVGVLVVSNRRKVKTNQQLTSLNREISQRKEELDWINHKQEEIIEERTKDLVIKNKKLSDYSWHLSHQIRGPVASMKGLMLLQKDCLIDNEELMREINHCLDEIDFKIVNINEDLNDPKKSDFIPRKSRT